MKNKSINKTCEKCGEIFSVLVYRTNTARFCSKKCTIPWHKGKSLSEEHKRNIGLAFWKGGNTVIDGYNYKKKLGGKYIREHHIEWLKHNDWGMNHIPTGWVVHHKNGDRQDNTIENLVCIPRGYHNRLHGEIRKIQGGGLK